jgi:APA family basic amino acid/polyamine antiporter
VTTSKPTRGHLLRVLGLGFGLAVIIGNMIGAGILRNPGTIAAQLPNIWLFLGVWVVAGLYAFLGAISLAELGVLIPRSGGQYVFARYTLGEYAGFIVGWSDWISTSGSTSAICLVVGTFTGALFPSLGSTTWTLVIASGASIFFALLQWRGIVMGSVAQNITSLAKALAFGALIVAALALGTGGSFREVSASPPAFSFALLAAIVVSLQAAIYTYDGWTGVIYFSEEVKDPARVIPRSMIGGVLSVIAIYLLVNVALLYVLPISQIARTDFAAGVAANVLFGPHGDTIFRTLTIVSMFSAINSCHLMATRVLYAMSRDGLFMQRAAVVNKGGTPGFALLLTTGISILFIVFGQRFEKVITVLAFFFVGNYALSFISVFVLRWREGERERPYKAWGYPWTTGLALIGSIVFLAGAMKSDTENSLYALGLLAVSYPVYRLLKLPQRRREGSR